MTDAPGSAEGLVQKPQAHYLPPGYTLARNDSPADGRDQTGVVGHPDLGDAERDREPQRRRRSATATSTTEPRPSTNRTAPCSSLPGSGSSPVEVSAAIEGLSANTTYHFRIVASNAGGTSAGEDETFTTPPERPTVLAETPTSLEQTSATLNATVNPNGAAVSDCHFDYGTSSFYGSSAPCSSLPGSGSSPVAVSAAIEGLSANTTYHFRIVATNAGGTSAGEDETFTTPPERPTVLAETPTSLEQTSATLNATVNPNGAAVSDCHFDYGTSTFYESTRPAPRCPAPDAARSKSRPRSKA